MPVSTADPSPKPSPPGRVPHTHFGSIDRTEFDGQRYRHADTGPLLRPAEEAGDRSGPSGRTRPARESGDRIASRPYRPSAPDRRSARPRSERPGITLRVTRKAGEAPSTTPLSRGGRLPLRPAGSPPPTPTGKGSRLSTAHDPGPHRTTASGRDGQGRRTRFRPRAGAARRPGAAPRAPQVRCPPGEPARSAV